MQDPTHKYIKIKHNLKKINQEQEGENMLVYQDQSEDEQQIDSAMDEEEDESIESEADEEIQEMDILKQNKRSKHHHQDED